MKTAIGAILVFGGLVAMAGSAGDCDGACMEQANTIGEMLMIIAGSMVAMAIGAVMLKDSLLD